MPVNGLVTMTPSSIASTGTGNSSSINSNGSVTFATCNTLSLNGVFTSSYDNYMIVCRMDEATALAEVRYRLRVAGTDNTTTNSYVTQQISASSTTVSGTRTTANYGGITANYTTTKSGFTLYMFGPYLAQETATRSVAVTDNQSGSILDKGSTHNQATSYDGITLRFDAPVSGSPTVGGLITVYGFNQ